MKSLQRRQTFEYYQLAEGQLSIPTLSHAVVPRTQSLRTQSSHVRRGGEKWVRTHTLMREKLPVLPVPPGPTGSRRMLEWVQLNLSAIRLFTMHRSKCAHLRKRCLQIVNSQCSRFLSQTLEGSPYSALKERLECLGPSLQDDSGARARLVGEGTEG